MLSARTLSDRDNQALVNSTICFLAKETKTQVCWFTLTLLRCGLEMLSLDELLGMSEVDWMKVPLAQQS